MGEKPIPRDHARTHVGPPTGPVPVAAGHVSDPVLWAALTAQEWLADLLLRAATDARGRGPRYRNRHLPVGDVAPWVEDTIGDDEGLEFWVTIDGHTFQVAIQRRD